MFRFASTVALAAVLLSGCGQSPLAGQAPAALVEAQAKKKATVSPFSKLTDLQVKDGAPSDGYKKTKKHVAAKTAKRGQLWILDTGDAVEVLHNTQTVSDAKKLKEVANSLRTAGLELADEGDKKYVFMLASRIEWSIPGVR